jgi:hypothetical protein
VTDLHVIVSILTDFDFGLALWGKLGASIIGAKIGTTPDLCP